VNVKPYTDDARGSNAGAPVQSLAFEATVHPSNGSAPFCVSLVGREAWALLNLVEAGLAGCTPLTTPGPRWSHYVYRLRKCGFVIETIYEPHGGAFPGTHARYALRGRVVISGGTLSAWRPNGVRYPVEASVT
jgi:hypothetical protein